MRCEEKEHKTWCSKCDSKLYYKSSDVFYTFMNPYKKIKYPVCENICYV